MIMKPGGEINEVFDSPYQLIKAPDNMAVRYCEPNTSAQEMYFLPDEKGAVLAFLKNGYREIHHLDDESRSGFIDKNNQSPNPRFIATVLHLSKLYTEKNELVKILAPFEMAKTYYRLAVAIFKREPNFILGGLNKEKNGSRYQFVVHQRNTWYGYEKVGAVGIIEKTNQLYFGGELIL